MKPASRELYLYAIRWLRKRPSMALPVAAVTRDQIRTMRDELAETTPGKANVVLRVFRVLMSYAVERGWRTENPALRLKTIKGGEHRSWTDAELLQFEERWPRGTTERLIYELALGTGQRRGDIAKMTWADVKDGGINVVQEKTGAKIWVPLHASLKHELDSVQRRAAVILTTPTGRSYTSDYLGMWFSRAISESALPTDCVLHGLRKTATRRLAEAGASDREIMAITGHATTEMVGHYVKQADQADHLAFDSQKFDVALYRDAAGNARAASAAILSLMSERDEANARALNWECRFEAASARGAAAEARIRELSLSELTALGQADENHKRALDAEARLEKAKEALREIFEDTDAAGCHGAWPGPRLVLSDLERTDD